MNYLLFFLFLVFIFILFSLTLEMNFTFYELSLFMMEISINKSAQMFIFLVFFVSVLILFYSSYYMFMDFNFGYYVLLMFIFMLSMICLVISSSWVFIILSWEGLGLSSFFLINYNQAWESQNNAMVTLMTMRLGDFFMFLFMCNLMFNTYYNLNFLFSVESFCFIFFCFTKSAQIPFSGWLPKAMSAPTPTSALVHSSTLVTAGLVLMMNYSELLMSKISMMILLLFGLITMLLGSFLALVEFSVKKMVAYSTLSQMGLGVMVFGLGIFYYGYMNLIAHGLAKSLLFMQFGYIIHMNYNEQNMRKWGFSGNLEGVLRIQLLCSLMSLCGISFFNGMLSKEEILESFLISFWSGFLLLIIMLSIYMTFIYSFLIYKSVFSSSTNGLFNNHSSLFMMSLLLLEVFFMVSYFSWLIFNLINMFEGFNYVEVIMPVMFFILFFICFLFFVNLNLYYNYLIYVKLILSNYQHYLWFKLFMFSINKVESGLYLINNLIQVNVLYYIMVLKMSMLGKYSSFLFFFIIIIMLLV